MMNDTPEELRAELVSAAFDGERVDLAALREALTTDEAREMLASLLLLRATVAADVVRPPLKAIEAARSRAGTSWRPFASLPYGVRVAAAAGVAILLAVTSFWAGTTVKSGELGSRISATQRGIVVADSPERVPPPAVDDVPPPPVNRLLRYTPGVDWHPAS